MERSKYIGASEAGTIAGVNKYSSPYELYQTKVMGVEKEKTEPMIWGTLMESKVIEGVKILHGIEIKTPRDESGEQMGFFYEENIDGIDVPFMCHMDGCHTDEEGYWIDEIKCSSSFNKAWGTEDTDDVPQMYLMQGIQMMKILEANNVWATGVIFWVFQDMKLKKYVLRRDRDTESIWDAYKHMAAAFWKAVLVRTPPPPSTEADIRSAYKSEVSGNTIYASEEVFETLDIIKDAEAKIKSLQDLVKSMRVELMKSLRDAEAIVYDGKPVVSWKSQSRTIFGQKEFKESNPELYNQFLKTSESRVLRIHNRS